MGGWAGGGWGDEGGWGMEGASGKPEARQTPHEDTDFFTNQPSFVESCEVIPGISDHEIVSIISLTSISHSKSNPRNIILWHNADFEAINNLIAQFTDTFFGAYDHSTPVNILWNKFKTLCKSCVDMISQRLSYANDQLPWITRDIKRLSRKKQRKYNNACRTNSDKDWSAYCKLKKKKFKGFVAPPTTATYHHS